MSDAPRILMLDHKDSFVFVLAEQFLRIGAKLETYRCDISLAELEARIDVFDPHLVVLSPGPGHPNEAETTLAWLGTRSARPVLGVCLGHQAMAIAAGGSVERAPQPVHGRAAQVRLTDDPVLEGLPDPFPGARYHSLIVTSLPDELRAIATTVSDGAEIVMAMRHVELPWIGLQFHPESFLTPGGGSLLRRVLAQACEARG